jgi:hypothetical protein
MSNNLNIPEDRCSHGRLSSHSNDTAPLDTSPWKSWVNAGLLGHECGIFAQSDKIDVSTTKLIAAPRAAAEEDLDLRKVHWII